MAVGRATGLLKGILKEKEERCVRQGKQTKTPGQKHTHTGKTGRTVDPELTESENETKLQIATT